MIRSMAGVMRGWECRLRGIRKCLSVKTTSFSESKCARIGGGEGRLGRERGRKEGKEAGKTLGPHPIEPHGPWLEI